MMLPENQEDQEPFLLAQLQTQLKQAVEKYVSEPKNKERASFYKLRE